MQLEEIINEIMFALTDIMNYGYTADCHMHAYTCDAGAKSVEEKLHEVIKEKGKAGVLTEHDSVRSINEFLKKHEDLNLNENNIIIIPEGKELTYKKENEKIKFKMPYPFELSAGVELSTKIGPPYTEEASSLHLLGFFVPATSKEFIKELEKYSNARVGRMNDMYMSWLKEVGIVMGEIPELETRTEVAREACELMKKMQKPITPAIRKLDNTKEIQIFNAIKREYYPIVKSDMLNAINQGADISKTIKKHGVLLAKTFALDFKAIIKTIMYAVWDDLPSDYKLFFKHFEKYSPKPCFVGYERLPDYKEGIEFLKKYNSIVGVAHVQQMYEQEKFFEEAKKQGLEAIELAQRHTEKTVNQLIEIAKRKKLLLVAGSDDGMLERKLGLSSYERLKLAKIKSYERTI